MRTALALTAVVEGLTGLVLLVYPPILIRLLFDSEVAGAGVSASRIAGICLIALGVACAPGDGTLRAFLGMSTYNLLVMLYLAHVGVARGAGILLWPAVAAHAGLFVLLVWTWWKERHAPEADT